MTAGSHIWNIVPELNTEPPYPSYSPSFTCFWLEEFLVKTMNNLICINILLFSFLLVRQPIISCLPATEHFLTQTEKFFLGFI